MAIVANCFNTFCPYVVYFQPDSLRVAPLALPLCQIVSCNAGNAASDDAGTGAQAGHVRAGSSGSAGARCCTRGDSDDAGSRAVRGRSAAADHQAEAGHERTEAGREASGPDLHVLVFSSRLSEPSPSYWPSQTSPPPITLGPATFRVSASIKTVSQPSDHALLNPENRTGPQWPGPFTRSHSRTQFSGYEVNRGQY